MVAINQLDGLTASAGGTENVPVDNTKLKSKDAIILKSGDSLGSTVAIQAIALQTAVDYTTKTENVTYNGIAGTIVRVYGLDATKVVTVDGVTAKYYQQRNASGELTGETVHIACVAQTSEPKVSVADGTPVEIKFGDVDGNSNINSKDITYLNNCLNNKSVRTPKGTVDYALPTDLMELMVFDVNYDKAINSKDVTYLNNCLNNKSVRTPKGTVDYSLDTIEGYIK